MKRAHHLLWFVLSFALLACTSNEAALTTESKATYGQRLMPSRGLSDWEFNGTLRSIADASDSVAVITIDSTARSQFLDGGGDKSDPNACCLSSLFKVDVLELLKGLPLNAETNLLSLRESEVAELKGRKVVAFLVTRRASVFGSIAELDHDFYALTGSPGISTLVEIGPGRYGFASGRLVRSDAELKGLGEASIGIDEIRNIVSKSTSLRPLEVSDLVESSGSIVQSTPNLTKPLDNGNGTTIPEVIVVED